jgi:hypothetical protein
VTPGSTVTDVTDIPAPPFTGLATAQRFHGLLLLYVRELKRPGEPVGLHQFLLGQAVSWHAPRGGAACTYCEPPSHSFACQAAGDQPDGGRACAQCGPPYPCRTVLSVATVSRFPVPWTPVGLVLAMKAVGLLPSVDRHRDDLMTPTLRWGGDGWADPALTATRDQRTGGWIVHSKERSTEHTERLADDAAFCNYLLGRAHVHVFPYAWEVEPSWVSAVRPGVAQARSWWMQHAQLPYLESERSSGSG